MLPGGNSRLGSIGEFLVSGWSGFVGEGAADLTQNLHWGDRARPGIGVLQEQRADVAGVGMRDGATSGHTVWGSVRRSDAGRVRPVRQWPPAAVQRRLPSGQSDRRGLA